MVAPGLSRARASSPGSFRAQARDDLMFGPSSGTRTCLMTASHTHRDRPGGQTDETADADPPPRVSPYSARNRQCRPRTLGTAKRASSSCAPIPDPRSCIVRTAARWCLLCAQTRCGEAHFFLHLAPIFALYNLPTFSADVWYLVRERRECIHPLQRRLTHLPATAAGGLMVSYRRKKTLVGETVSETGPNSELTVVTDDLSSHFRLRLCRLA